MECNRRGPFQPVFSNKASYLKVNISKANNTFTSKPVKIWYSDMYKNFDNKNNYFTYHLKKHFNIELNPKPDFLIHSVYSNHYLNYDCFRICITGENTRPDFKKSDFHIGSDYNDSPYYFRWPLFLMNAHSPETLLASKDTDANVSQKKRFCSFVVSNENSSERIDFFKLLSAYKKVDSGGRVLNNIGYNVEDKFSFLRESKFNIAFENSSWPGYTTEKIIDAFLSNSIPVYWGNPRISEDFNERSFINAHNFKTTNELIEYIKYVDEHDDVYRSMLAAPYFPGNKIPHKFRLDKLMQFFDFIFSQSGKKKPAARFFNKVEYISDYLYKKIR